MAELYDVSRIIGWKLTENPWYRPETAYREEPYRIEANGEYWNTSKRPTVDDLLAWLRCDAYLVVHQLDHWHVKFVNTDSGLDGEWFAGSTLLAALETAVRHADAARSEAGTDDEGSAS